MKKLIKTWNGRGIQDDGAYVSKEFSSFCRQFINAVKREFPDDEIVNYSKGHYYLSGFIKRGAKFVYFSYHVPRGGLSIDMARSDALRGILIRKAHNEKDYTGEDNHFTSFFHFKENVEYLFRK